MNDASSGGSDYSQTLFLPKTDFPMRAGLPEKEPEILARWERDDLYGSLRASGKGRPKFVLHDGPPYANGEIHIGTALNKILKDLVVRSQQMAGKESNYVPGWDCHGLPIEWKVEEEFYRKKGKTKPDFSDAEAVIEFRRECRAYAEHWINVQREQFKRLGVTGDWDHPYTTMSFPAEAQIAREIFKFVANGLLYRGSKPVMWSVVEKTALAEAEIEYEDYTSDTIHVAFPIEGDEASIVVWTTTPWTIPGNRAIAFSRRIAYGSYRVTGADPGNWAKTGATYIVAKALAEATFAAARVRSYEFVVDIEAETLGSMACAHPLRAHGYGFVVPLLSGDHVTDDAGTGFVHTAPGHGREDFELWTSNGRPLVDRGIDTRIPYTVDENGSFTDEAPGFTGKRVITDKGDKGDANEAVIAALAGSGALLARGKLKHQYPHSWRSKKPVIFRNTPQWFLAMDRPFADAPNGGTLREVAIGSIERTRWEPKSGENRIKGMVQSRPDWVLSRQRAWGVPLAIFVRRGGHEVLYDEQVNERIAAAFEKEGADAWFKEGAKERFLGSERNPEEYEKIDNLVEVWFDSGSTHAFVLEDSVHFPGLAGIKRGIDGGEDQVMYLEGSDQHRGWFQSSLLESCGTRGRAPFDIVLTHGFTLDEKGRKMSKSLGNQTFPQDVIRTSGADILRLWVASVDYSDDQRIGPDILKAVSDHYRKLRNTLRWMLGTLSHHSPDDSFDFGSLESLERLMLHKLQELSVMVRDGYANFDYSRVLAALSSFMNVDLSAFYFDIRKDSLYCDAPSSQRRRGALETIGKIFDAVAIWLAPVLVFTTEEAWAARGRGARSIHLETFPVVPTDWRDEDLASQWETVRALRSVVTGAIEVARARKEIGSSLEAAPRVYLGDPKLADALVGIDFADICITSDVAVEISAPPPDGAFRLPEMPSVAVVIERAAGVKCARSWRYFDPSSALPGYPDVTPRDAIALRELKALGRIP